MELLKLEKDREKAYGAMINLQQTIKRWFDKKTSNPEFKEGSLVLMYDERTTKLEQHTKFEALWKGPF